MTKYREKKYICGKYMEVCIYPVFEQMQGKRKRIKQSTAVQKALNDHNREKKLTRLMNANFTDEDMKIELTYTDEFLPKTDEDANRELRNFFRRIKRFRKREGLPELKYIVITERGKRSGRYHHHIVMSGGMLLKDVRDTWGKGIIRMTQLEETERGYAPLARYLSKKLVAGAIEENEKAWHSSRNLIQPKELQNDSRISKKRARSLYENQECRDPFENLYPEYDFVECRPIYNEINGQYYLYVYMRKKEKPKPKRKKVRTEWQTTARVSP